MSIRLTGSISHRVSRSFVHRSNASAERGSATSAHDQSATPIHPHTHTFSHPHTPRIKVKSTIRIKSIPTHTHTPTHPHTHAGFTLIEMLTVLAILGILFGLLFIPLTQSFHFVSSEQNQIQIQNVTREALRQVSGTIAEAMQVTTFPDNPTRIDLVLPAASLANQPTGVAPTTQAGTANLPGQIWETFFVGLANPGLPNNLPGGASIPYNNPNARKVTGGAFSAQASDENEYIIWRAVYNLRDPNDPVAKAVSGSAANLASNAWLFDDSLKPSLVPPPPAGGRVVPPTTVVVSNASRSLLYQMRNYTARVLTTVNGNQVLIPVAAQLTPVAISGHLDAIRSKWDTTSNGWVLDPRVSFLPSTSQNEILAPSQFGTEFQSSRGEWVTSGPSAGSAFVYWGYNWALHYGSAMMDGTVPGGDGQPMPITILNGPSANTMITTQGQSVPAFLPPDPRTGKVNFSQFQVTETIAVRPGVAVYPLYFPSQSYLSNNFSDTNYAQLLDASNNNTAKVRPQILPHSDSLSVVTVYPQTLGGGSNTTTYLRSGGNLITANIFTNSPGSLSYTAASGGDAAPGSGSLGSGQYIINYGTNPDVQMAPGFAQPFQPYQSNNPPAWDQNYNYGDEVPLIEIPYPGGTADPNILPYDPNTQTGTLLKLTYRFTFSTLDGLGNPLVKAAASYASQRFIQVNIGFRRFDESNSTPQDYSLSTSIGSANPIDEQPNGE